MMGQVWQLASSKAFTQGVACWYAVSARKAASSRSVMDWMRSLLVII